MWAAVYEKHRRAKEDTGALIGDRRRHCAPCIFEAVSDRLGLPDLEVRACPGPTWCGEARGGAIRPAPPGRAARTTSRQLVGSDVVISPQERRLTDRYRVSRDNGAWMLGTARLERRACTGAASVFFGRVKKRGIDRAARR